MLSRMHHAKAAIAVIGFCGALGLAVPVMAQNTSSDMNRQAPSGPNAPAAPSTKPATSPQDTSTTGGNMGSESRGSRNTPPSNEEGKPTTGH